MIREYLRLPIYLLGHPFDGFYDMKFEKKGKQSIIFINVILFWISYSFLKQYSAVIVNPRNPLSLNSLTDLGAIIAIFTLWCIGNWSITTLMNGEGKLIDIAMASAYALTPMIITFIPMSIISNFLTATEGTIYFLAIGVSVVWFLILLFIGILTVHNYTASKTVATIFLTFISVLIILFLIMLIFALTQQVWVFVQSVYIELMYRN